MFERKTNYHVTYFEVKNKSRLSGYSVLQKKNKYHVANEKGCVTVVKRSAGVTFGVLTSK